MRASATIGLLFLAGASLATASQPKFKFIHTDELAALLADKSGRWLCSMPTTPTFGRRRELSRAQGS